MRRFFIYRYRRFGTGMYVASDDPITKYLYLHRPWAYDSSNDYPEHWTNDRNNATAVFFDPEKYIEVPEDVLPLLDNPDYLGTSNGFEDRLSLPMFCGVNPRPERKIKGSNVKHKIGVPKNKLP